LERAVGNNPNVKVIPSFTENKKAYYKKLVKMGYEGIVLKDLRGKYNDRFMTKKKPIYDDDFVIMDYTEGKGKYKGLFGAIVYGKYVNGKLVRVGKVGSGFDEKERIKINKKLKNLIKNKAVIAIRHLGLSHKGVPEGPVFDRIRTSKTFHDMLAESLGEQSPSVNAS
jgi:ATP-dependent DNA ligase